MEGAEKPTQSDRGLLVDIWELVRGAPVMVSVIYGIPAMLFLVGIVAAMTAVGKSLGFIAEPLRLLWLDDERLVIASVFLAFPAYWLLSGIHAGLYALGLISSASAMATSPNETQHDEKLSNSCGSSAEPAPLVVKVNQDEHRASPLSPWLPVSSQSDSKREEWPGEFRFRKIALVLSGGGAKGVYQAGAMKAIYEFLREKQALNCVVSVAGTSIGAWNALFWLAGMLDKKNGDDAPSKHEMWWTTTRLSQLVRPSAMIIPGASRHLMSSTPWQRQFDELFGSQGTDSYRRLTQVIERKSRVRFYITRTNVLQGRLSFDTNNPISVETVGANTHDLDQARLTTSIDRLKRAVFTSMGIPPLFDYTYVASPNAATYCEDGGVINNLPVRLATYFGACDLLFILPLNASFFQRDLPYFMPSRLARVIDVRQGMLERTELKSVYLFNQRFVFAGERNPIPAFAIAPGQETLIDTTELWKLERYGKVVFDQMYRATKQALKEFFSPENLWNFYHAFERMRDEPPKDGYKRLPKEGYNRLAIVDPGWDDGNQFEYEDRF